MKLLYIRVLIFLSILSAGGHLQAQCATEYVGEYGFRFCGYADTLPNYQFTSSVEFISETRIMIRNFHNIPESIIHCEDTIFANIDCATDSLFFESMSFQPPGLTYSGSGHKVNDTITVNYHQINPGGSQNVCLIYVRGLADGIRSEIVRHQPFVLYPNPCRDYISIAAGSATVLGIDVLNSSGLLVRSYSEPEIHPISLQKLESGLYFIRINTSAGVGIQRIVKE